MEEILIGVYDLKIYFSRNARFFSRCGAARQVHWNSAPRAGGRHHSNLLGAHCCRSQELYMGEQAKNCHSIVFSYLIDKSQKLLQIPSCKSNLARHWSLILNDRLICFRVLLKEKIFSCLDFLIRTATRTANYQFCSLLDLHNAPKHSLFL
jgi:hypothetical protein